MIEIITILALTSAIYCLFQISRHYLLYFAYEKVFENIFKIEDCIGNARELDPGSKIEIEGIYISDNILHTYKEFSERLQKISKKGSNNTSGKEKPVRIYADFLKGKVTVIRL